MPYSASEVLVKGHRSHRLAYVYQRRFESMPFHLSDCFVIARFRQRLGNLGVGRMAPVPHRRDIVDNLSFGGEDSGIGDVSVLND